jgi:hypothetical protein
VVASFELLLILVNTVLLRSIFYIGYTKLFVGVGFTAGITNVETINLETKVSNCSNLKSFPDYLVGAIGGLEFSDNPFICGGCVLSEYKQNCFALQNSAWEVFYPLTEKRCFASSCPSPFPQKSHKLLVAGGYDGSGQFFLFL